MVVCHCKAVNDARIRELATTQCTTTADVAKKCGAGSDCGSCLTVIEELLTSIAGRPGQ